MRPHPRKVPAQPEIPHVLIGGVGYRWMRDMSFGVVVSDALACLSWPPGVRVDDLGYGALLVAQDLAMADPPYDRLVLIAAVKRGRTPGNLRLYEWNQVLPPDDEILERIREAGGGVIDLDHLLIIAGQQGALPAEVSVVEFEPLDSSPGIELSPVAASLVPKAIEMARQAALAPLRAGQAQP